MEGFRSTPDGVLCIDWDVVVPYQSVLTTEGRHLSGPDAADKIEEAYRKYITSPKGREARRRYREGKGRLVDEAYQKSEKGRLTAQKYRFSDKGQAVFQDFKDRGRTFRQARKWLLNNPDKAFEDYLKITHQVGFLKEDGD